MSRGPILVRPGRGYSKAGSFAAGALATGTCWVLLAGCGGGGTQVSSTARPAAAAATTASTTAAPATRASPPVMAVSNAKLGTILADAGGMVLYTYTGKGGCAGACLKNWSPLLLPAGARSAVAGPGVTGLGTLAQSGGTEVTFHGKPLYTFAGDSRPGETEGQGVVDAGGIWNVAVVKAPVAATPTVPPASPVTTPPVTTPPVTTPPVTTPAGTAPRPTAPLANHPPVTRAPTRATTPAAPVTMAPTTAPVVTHTRTTPTPPVPTTPRPTVPATTIPGGGVSY